MASTLKLAAKKRTVLGHKVAKLRQQQLLPANIYGKGVKSLAIELPVKEFKTAFTQAGETGIINLIVDEETKPRPVLIGNIQVDPVSDSFLHVDFRQVDLSQKVSVAVPVEFIGEAPAVNKGGVLVKLINEVEIEALPDDLPDKLEVDIAGLEEIGQSLALNTIKLDSAKVKLMAENPDELVVKIEAPAKEEKEEAAPVPTETAPVEAEAATPAPADEKAKKPPSQDQDKKPAPNKP